MGSMIMNGYPQGQGLNCSLHQLLEMDKSVINSYRSFAGHWGTGLYSLLNRNIPSFTMLRDPFERTVSFIQYFGKIESQEMANFENPRDLWRSERLRAILLEEEFPSLLIFNSQTFYLGYDLDFCKYSKGADLHEKMIKDIPSLEYVFAESIQLGVNIDEVAKKAISRINEMEILGLSERFDESAKIVCSYIGINHSIDLPQQRVSKERRQIGVGLTYRESGLIPSEIIKKIDKVNQYDQEIYEHGKKIFEQQLKKSKRSLFSLFGLYDIAKRCF